MAETKEQKLGRKFGISEHFSSQIKTLENDLISFCL